MSSSTTDTPNTSRKNLISSLLVGLILGGLAGTCLGWVAHRFYAEQRLAGVLICRDKNRNQPEYIVQSKCGPMY